MQRKPLAISIITTLVLIALMPVNYHYAIPRVLNLGSNGAIGHPYNKAGLPVVDQTKTETLAYGLYHQTANQYDGLPYVSLKNNLTLSWLVGIILVWAGTLWKQARKIKK
jgi:hypothetical protein